MRASLSYFIIFCCAGLTACSPASDSQETPAPAMTVDPLVEHVEQVLTEVYSDELPGATVVISQKGDLIVETARGMADMEMDVALQPHHILRLASVTKQYTAATILKLVEQGKLVLDAPVGDVLPSFHVPEITIHQLLNHTSGLPSYTDVPGYVTGDDMRADLSTAEIIALTSDLPLEFTPGSQWRYNNSAYVVLGAVIEEVTGKSWHEAMQELLFEPLGLGTTGYYSAAEITPGRVEGYMQQEQLVNAPFISMTQPHAAGALSATAADVDKWQRALHGGKVLSDALYSRMIDTSQGLQNYAYGLSVTSLRGEQMISHSGGIHGFNTYALWLPEQEVSVVVLSNYAGHTPAVGEVALRLASQVIGKPFPIEKPTIELPASELQALVGTYQISDDEQRSLSLNDGVLYSQRDGGRKLAVAAVGNDQFVLEDSLVYFEALRNEAGQVTGLNFYQIATTEPEYAEKISDKAPQRSVINLSDSQAQRLVGNYELMPGFVISIRHTEAGMVAQATGQSAFVVQAESPSVLFNDEFGIVMEFELPEQGPASQLMLMQGGQKSPAPRMQDQKEGE
ncbi:beta-lactamase family protein [Pseudidiomarina sp. 1APR75-33.1]|uniref:serine hydrolase domain-containing protein n=1 Tax=Pseudidiomarina terrestris TaxID=2820060 RepID=UPI00264AE64A|nr:serine hydrolase domain-containing protein [Pseudidiomarina sp. 1APR75-33.1]MDN7126065.1 beta-lactamase family protein [Pseudidiomarina sp. 1APR75-33.1]